MEDFLKGLNKEQLEAVTTIDGPLLVLSGAGTGKTRVLTTRIAYIIASGFARPWEILALTFTNRAGNEMKERLRSLIGSSADQVWMGTFHGLGVRILRTNCNLVNLKSNFLIYNDDDQKAMLKIVMQELNIDIKKFLPADAVDIISKLKDKGIGVDQFQNQYNSIKGVNLDFADGRLFDIYKLYQEHLEKNNAVDYGDLILKTLNLLLKNNDVLQKYQNQFKYILVDEYQDTNTAQYMLLRLFASKYKNICCVGDDDQSIYSWRGAVIQNILNFEKDYIGAKVIRLEKNYRSSPAILACANSLIKNNAERLGKNLVSGLTDNSDEKVVILQPYSDRDEAIKIADIIEDLHDNQNINYNQIAILARNAEIFRIFENEFVSRRLPYSIIGDLSIYDRAEIRDAIAYLRVFVYRDDDVSFRRILNNPARGLGNVSLGKISEYAKINSKSLFEASEDMIKQNILPKKMTESLNEFINIFKSLELEIQSLPPEDICYNLLVKSGYIAKLQDSKDIDAKDRLNRIKGLIKDIKDSGGSLELFLEQFALRTTNDEVVENDHISIMTMHAAKGLEFDIVFLPAWEMGIFPSERTVREEGDSGLEEERRLAYVAITRARKKLFISSCKSRFLYGSQQNNLPSVFFDEMDNKFLDTNWGIKSVSNICYSRKNTSVFSRADSILGMEVEHVEFGKGIVIEQEENERTTFLTIAFKNYGLKRVEKSYIKVIK